MTLGSLLTLPSLALQTSAKALRLLAFANEAIAARLAEPEPRAEAPRFRPTPVPTPAAAPTAPARASAAGDADAGDVDAADIPRDIPTLAALPAPAVSSAVESLTLAELDDLYAYESSHRRRRAVLAAVEAALAPPAHATDDDLLDDVREPDELVYTTSTPRR